MKLRSINWPMWAGLVLSFFVTFSYPFIFAQWPSTRDFPWANLLLLAISVVLIFMGVRRAFAPGKSKISKVGASVLSLFSVLFLALFIFTTFIMARWIPASKAAPQVGQKAPDFTMTDSAGKQVTLAELLSSPVNGKTPKGVLLVFYRGYW